MTVIAGVLLGLGIALLIQHNLWGFGFLGASIATIIVIVHLFKKGDNK